MANARTVFQHPAVMPLALAAAGSAAVAAALIVGQAAPDGSAEPAGSVTGVTAETTGSNAAEDERKGIVAVATPETRAVTIQSIPGIEGIDTVVLENLEAVLRMQDRTTEQRAQGQVRAAAALMSMEPSDEPPQETVDAREEHQEFELEGS
jgi:hypothetical protein